jgi:hypothetical protein
MERLIVFDVRFSDESGLGIVVDTDLYVEFFEQNSETPTETRVLGTDTLTQIVPTSDANGVLYTTTINGATYGRGLLAAKWFAKRNGVPMPIYPFVEVKSNLFGDNELTPDGLKTYARSMLGFPAINVELASSHYNEVLEETLNLYGKWVPQLRITFILPTTTLQKFPLPHLPVSGPTDVKFVRKAGIPVLSDPFFGREYPRTQTLDFAAYVLGTSFWETVYRVSNQEPEWEWMPETKTLYINVGNTLGLGAIGGYFVGVRYLVHPALDAIRQDHFQWVKRYFLVRCKSILAQIRGKYSGVIPAPGGSMQLNSRELREEVREEEERLRLEIESMAPAVPPVYG